MDEKSIREQIARAYLESNPDGAQRLMEQESGKFGKLMGLSKDLYRQTMNGVGKDAELAKIINDIVALRVRIARELELSKERADKKDDEESPVGDKGGRGG